jgi:DNA-binding protein H-NS
LARLANKGLDNITEDIDKIRKENPIKAAEIYLKLLEYVVPKLKSVDMKVDAEVNAKIDKLKIEVIQRDGSKDKDK